MKVNLSPNVQLKKEPVLQQHRQHQQQISHHHHSPPTVQQRYLIPNTPGMVPAPAHIGFIPTTQSQVHLSAHPLPAHLPAFLQQQGTAAAAAAQFTVTPSHATYLTQAGMMGALPAAAAAGLAASRAGRQQGFPGYLYPGYE